MLRRQRGVRRRALLSLWSSVSDVRTQSGRFQPNCNSVLPRRGTGPHHIVVFVIVRDGQALAHSNAGLIIPSKFHCKFAREVRAREGKRILASHRLGRDGQAALARTVLETSDPRTTTAAR